MPRTSPDTKDTLSCPPRSHMPLVDRLLDMPRRQRVADEDSLDAWQRAAQFLVQLVVRHPAAGGDDRHSIADQLAPAGNEMPDLDAVINKASDFRFGMERDPAIDQALIEHSAC